MIVFIVNDLGVFTFKPEGHPSIPTDINSPRTGPISFQFVKLKAREIHILRLSCGMKAAKYQSESFRMRGLDSGDISGFEEASETLMLETPNHVP